MRLLLLLASLFALSLACRKFKKIALKTGSSDLGEVQVCDIFGGGGGSCGCISTGKVTSAVASSKKELKAIIELLLSGGDTSELSAKLDAIIAQIQETLATLGDDEESLQVKLRLEAALSKCKSAKEGHASGKSSEELLVIIRGCFADMEQAELETSKMNVGRIISALKSGKGFDGLDVSLEEVIEQITILLQDFGSESGNNGQRGLLEKMLAQLKLAKKAKDEGKEFSEIQVILEESTSLLEFNGSVETIKVELVSIKESIASGSFEVSNLEALIVKIKEAMEGLGDSEEHSQLKIFLEKILVQMTKAKEAIDAGESPDSILVFIEESTTTIEGGAGGAFSEFSTQVESIKVELTTITESISSGSFEASSLEAFIVKIQETLDGLGDSAEHGQIKLFLEKILVQMNNAKEALDAGGSADSILVFFEESTTTLEESSTTFEFSGTVETFKTELTTIQEAITSGTDSTELSSLLEVLITKVTEAMEGLSEDDTDRRSFLEWILAKLNEAKTALDGGQAPDTIVVYLEESSTKLEEGVESSGTTEAGTTGTGTTGTGTTAAGTGSTTTGSATSTTTAPA